MQKIRTNQIVVIAISVIAAIYLIHSLKKPEKYEGDAGPSSNTENVPQISKEDLASVLKFIG